MMCSLSTVQVAGKRWVHIGPRFARSANPTGREKARGIPRGGRLVGSVRELIGLVGVERNGVKVTALAASLGKSEDGISLWVRRGVRRRLEDQGFAEDAEALDAALREGR